MPTVMPRPGLAPPCYVPAAPPRRDAARGAIHPDHDFISLLVAYRRSGGLGRACEVNCGLERQCGSGAATLVGWIADRRVVSFSWQAQTWLPWFQFKREDRSPHPALWAVCAELATVFDEWQAAHWFTQPNPLLDGCVPVDRLSDDPDSVRRAARSDRFDAADPPAARTSARRG